jgi:hypothetical protein
VGKPEGRRPLLGVDGRIILKRIFKKRYGGVDWIDLKADQIKAGGGSCKCGNKPSGYIKF